MLQHELLHIYASHENAMSLPLIYGQNNTLLAIVIKGYNAFRCHLLGYLGRTMVYANSYWF